MKIFFVLVGLLIVPLGAAAQTGLEGVIGTFSDLINAAIPLIIALAVLYFFWGLAKYILNASDEGAKEEGRSIMIWGVIAIFVMVSLFGLVQLLQETFNVEDGELDIPGVIKRN